MQCTWQNLARRSFGLPKNISNRLVPLGPYFSKQFTDLRIFPTRRLCTTSRPSNFLSPSDRPPSFSFFSSGLGGVEDIPSLDRKTSSSLPVEASPAERGRAASCAIRISLQQGNVADAYHVVNSVRLANFQSDSFLYPSISQSIATKGGKNTILSILSYPKRLSTAIHLHPVAYAFSADTSPRLPSHTLLHGLIKQGMTDEAASLAEQMMSVGMRVRSQSLEVLYSALAQTSITASSAKPSPNSSNVSHALPSHPLRHNVLYIRPGRIADPSTRFALRLLFLSRQSRQRRTHRMFKTLMTLCLINGEIILASLLFGVLVRDWQKRVGCEVQVQALEQDPEERQIKIKYDTPFPAWSHLHEMCEFINDSFASYSLHRKASNFCTDSETSLRYNFSLQALANLAGILDRQALPFGGLVDIIQTMYKCPTDKETVWVWRRVGVEDKNNGNGAGKQRREPKEIDARKYLRGVLRRLVGRLPSKSPSSKSDLARTHSTSESIRPPSMHSLTLQTYNTLLHYAFRYARSQSMAGKILDHMVNEAGLEPNAVTRNIIERGGTLLRVSDGCDKVMKKKDISHGDPLSDLLDIVTHYDKNQGRRQIDIDNLNYSLSTRIAHLVATGKPNVVVDAIPFLLPGITPLICAAPDTPPATCGSTEQDWVVQRQHVVQRAVCYGPVVLTSILNALMKVGRTGLSEKIWDVMKEAEELSWNFSANGKGSGSLSPWCLGVEAYTVMIKVYGKEARKGAGYGRVIRGVGPAGRGEEKMKRDMVVGWGYKFLQKRKIRRGTKVTRVELSRYMGLKIYRLMGRECDKMTRRVERLCLRLQTERASNDKASPHVHIVKNHLRLPDPDTYFFNAILDIVARRPGMTPRSRTLQPRRARARLTIKKRKYIWECRVMGSCEPDVRLREVVRDMRRNGFGVPVLVRRLLIGTGEEELGDECLEEGQAWLKVRKTRSNDTRLTVN